MSEGKSRLYPILVNTLDVAATPVTGRPVASLDVALRQDSEVVNYYPPIPIDQIDDDSDEDITDVDLSLIGLQVEIYTNTNQAPFQSLETALALTFQRLQSDENFQISKVELEANITNSLEILARYTSLIERAPPNQVQFLQDQLVHKQRQHDTILNGLQQYTGRIIEHIANKNAQIEILQAERDAAIQFARLSQEAEIYSKNRNSQKFGQIHKETLNHLLNAEVNVYRLQQQLTESQDHNNQLDTELYCAKATNEAVKAILTQSQQRNTELANKLADRKKNLFNIRRIAAENHNKLLLIYNEFKDTIYNQQSTH
jgi:hypothetical protein